MASLGVSEEELTGSQIRYFIDEILNQIHHLKRSQEELKKALENEEDEDFIDAVRENEVVLINKRRRVKGLIELLEKVDPAYNQEKQNEIQDITNALFLVEVNAMELDENMNGEVQSGGSILEVYSAGQRQINIERRILDGEPEPTSRDEGLYL
jgi:hypothetical protein